MERSESIKELAMALSKAQGEIKPALKDSNNPFFKSKYADLASVWEVCRGPLSKNGLTVMQHPTAEGNIVSVETIVIHSTGEWISSKLTMVSKEQTPQGIGSTITYARRYSLSSIIGIASEEDDDGNAASGKTTSAPSATQAHTPTKDIVKAKLLEQLAIAKTQLKKLTGKDDAFFNVIGEHGFSSLDEVHESEKLQQIFTSLNAKYKEIKDA